MSNQLNRKAKRLSEERRLLRTAGAVAISLVLLHIFFGGGSGRESLPDVGAVGIPTTTTIWEPPLIVEDLSADRHDSEVVIPQVPALPEGVMYDSEIATVVILLSSYEFGERSTDVEALQEVVGETTDGLYGLRTRAAHISALREARLDTSVVPEPVVVTTTTAPPVYEPGVEQWRGMVEDAVYAFGGDQSDVTRFLRIMHCESRGLPNAYNRSSGASGLMQHLPRYWDMRTEAIGMAGADIFDPWVNIYASAWLALAADGGGWFHWECNY